MLSAQFKNPDCIKVSDMPTNPPGAEFAYTDIPCHRTGRRVRDLTGTAITHWNTQFTILKLRIAITLP